MSEKKRLNLNLDSLIPGESLAIGETSVMIRPLGLFQIKMVTGQLGNMFKVFRDKGITFSNTKQEFTDPEDTSKTATYLVPPNYKDPENLMIIAETLVTQFPDVLSEVSGIHIDDLGVLPLDIILTIVDKCLDVNLKSKETLLGNWKSLTTKLEKMNLLEVKKTSPESQPEQKTPKQ